MDGLVRKPIFGGVNPTQIRSNRHKLGGRYGCFESHLKMYKIALDKKVPYALLFEDDFYLRAKTMNKTINLALQCIKENPDFYRISLQNSGTIRANKTQWNGIFNADFLNLRCYIISSIAMKESIEKGIAKQNHIDITQLIEFFYKKNIFN